MSTSERADRHRKACRNRRIRDVNSRRFRAGAGDSFLAKRSLQMRKSLKGRPRIRLYMGRDRHPRIRRRPPVNGVPAELREGMRQTGQSGLGNHTQVPMANVTVQRLSSNPHPASQW